MRIIEPLHLLKGGRSGEKSARASREWVLRRGVGRCRSAARNIQAVVDQLTDIRPGTFNILRHLADSCPIVINDSEAAVRHGFVIEAVGKAKSGPEVAIVIV